MNLDLHQKTAIITGASKGIGEAIAVALAGAGANVVVSSRKQEAVDEVAHRIVQNGGQASALAANAGSREDLERLAKHAIDQFGGIDIVINNAATNPVFGPVENTDERAFDKIMAVNLKGPFELAKLALPSMQARGGGAIVNISSIGGLSPEHFLGIYSVSKAAIISLTKVMAREWGSYGIRANAICPGLIETKFSEALWTNDEIMKWMMARTPLGRIGTPEEVANVALFLVSEAGAYCTGAVFTADGGYTI